MIHVKNNPQYYINARALTFSENDLGDPNRVAVSLVSGTVVMVHEKGTIDYASDGSYEKWTLRGYSTKLVKNDKYYIYTRLSRADKTALIVFSANSYNLDGSITTITGKDEEGNDITETTDPNENYFYIKIGELTETDGSSLRELTYDSGLLGTDKAKDESDGLSEMWELSKLSTPWLIRAKQWLSSFTVKGFITLVGGLIFKSGEEEKQITDIKRSTDNDIEVPVTDDSVPTTRYVTSVIEDLEDKYLRKDSDDRSSGKIASDKGFEAGNFLEGASGASVYQDEQGAWHIETDNLKVRRKFSASDVDIQSTDHIGGQALLTAARMRVDYVLEEPEYYRCYFRKTDGDGNVIRNEWQPSDLAYCNTFNLERQSDGSVGNHYYWRKVVAVSSETNQDTESERTFGDETIRTADYHFVDLSRLEQEYAEGSSAPKSGDKVVHLGYSGDDDPERQSAIVIAGAGTGSPYIRIFQGIHNFTLPSDPEQLKPGDNRLSGRMSIKAGSTGWENLAGLPEKIQEAMNSAVDLEGLEYGKNNLLLNSGFTGDFVTASLSGESMLKGGSQMFSPSLKYWDVSDDVAVQVSEVSESGYEVFMTDGGFLAQTLLMKVVSGDNYIFSFRGKGGAIRFTFGDVYHQFDLNDDDWHTYSHKFQAPEGVSSLRVEAVADCNICELQLERGTVRSAWGMSPLDNRSELAKYESMSHIRNLLKQNGLLEAGVVNTGLITMGKVGDDGELTGNTAGISGQYNDDDSVAFWAGGDYEQALYAIATYLDNPNYTPTRDELSNMAKFVVTHGGRAILNDIVLRGYVYALGGYFKGEVNAEKGIFKNVQSPNGHFKINDDGTVEIVGKIETSVNGKKIVIDADTNAIILYDQIGRETAKMAFSEGLWATGFVSLKKFNGESNNVVAETTITPTYSIFQQNGYRAFFGFDGMSVMKENEDEILLKVGLNPYGSGVNIEGYEPIFMVNESIGITQDITIDAYYAKHKLVFKDGLLVGYTRTDNDN